MTNHLAISIFSKVGDLKKFRTNTKPPKSTIENIHIIFGDFWIIQAIPVYFQIDLFLDWKAGG